MKILIIFFISLSMNMLSVNTKKALNLPQPSNYILVDGNTMEVYEGNRYHDQRSIASITKIMTALIALEDDSILFNVVKVDDVVKTIEGSSLYLDIGTEITIIDLIYGLILRSGNDAAVILAKTISGSVEKFVEKMNEKAKEIGMKNTIFNNPTGLDIFDQGNYSTPYDIALLMSNALLNERFVEISSTKYYKTPSKGMWKNKNRLLFNYKYCISGKTGFTKKARRTLVTASEKDDSKLICVTFNYGDDFEFHKQIYTRYFSKYHYELFLKRGDNYLLNYLVISKREIGLLIDNEIKRGVKKYLLYPEDNFVKVIYLNEGLNEVKSYNIYDVEIKLLD